MTGDMASFLNELKSAGKDKLRKTVGSLKYYNPQNHFGRFVNLSFLAIDY